MTQNPFEMLGVEERMLLDRASIERAYLSIASTLHPDIARGDLDASNKIAALNEARSTLLDAERRANALLAARAGPSAEDDRTLPDGFLMEIMEIRERAELAAETGDDALRSELMYWASARREEHAGKIGSLLDDRTPSAADLVSARIELNAWRYIERMLEQVDQKRGV